MYVYLCLLVYVHMYTYLCKYTKIAISGLKLDQVDLLIWVKLVTFSPGHVDNQIKQTKPFFVFISKWHLHAHVIQNVAKMTHR